MASGGLTEAAARSAMSTRGWIDGPPPSMVVGLVADTHRDVLVGAWVVGLAAARSSAC